MLMFRRSISEWRDSCKVCCVEVLCEEVDGAGTGSECRPELITAAEKHLISKLSNTHRDC